MVSQQLTLCIATWCQDSGLAPRYALYLLTVCPSRIHERIIGVYVLHVFAIKAAYWTSYVKSQHNMHDLLAVSIHLDRTYLAHKILRAKPLLPNSAVGHGYSDDFLLWCRPCSMSCEDTRVCLDKLPGIEASPFQRQYLSDVRLWTKTCVDAPRATTLANELRIEVRVHLHQQSRPSTLSLQVDSI